MNASLNNILSLYLIFLTLLIVFESSTGREQAALTGERLKELTFPYSRIVYSTMTRATETASIILEKLGKIEEVEHCDLLREGAPIPPEPPIGSWRPEMHVCYYFYFCSLTRYRLENFSLNIQESCM